LHSIRQFMTMRAEIEENESVGNLDDRGQEIAPSWVTKESDVPCYVYSKNRRVAIDTNKDALVSEIRGQFPLDTDIKETYRIATVRDKRGAVVFDGTILIDAIQRRRDHFEVALRRVDSGA